MSAAIEVVATEIEYALTMDQPVASAMVHPDEKLRKQIENRSWVPRLSMLGKRIWIHAGLSFSTHYAELCRERGFGFRDEVGLRAFRRRDLPEGSILGSAKIVGWANQYTQAGLSEEEADHVRRDTWFLGPYGWLLGDMRALRKLVFCSGRQKLWRPPVEVIERIRMLETA